jgi:hypothetical protein
MTILAMHWRRSGRKRMEGKFINNNNIIIK